MTGLIKSSNAARFSISDAIAIDRGAGQTRDLPPLPPGPELIAARAEIARLANLILERDQEIAVLKAGIADARIEGEAHARLAIERDDTARLSALKAGLEKAHGEFSDAMSHADILAAGIAQACLRQVFGHPNGYATMVGEAVTAAIAGLSRGSVVLLSVSPADFSDAVMLEELTKTCGLPGAIIVIDPVLSAGACTIKLKHGSIDVGPHQQWLALADLIDDFLAAEAGR
jgi:flagellar biosynthesis/type III secretory pathway protein FliH